MSHLKGHTDYGHQAVGVMLSCNGVVLNYDNVMYDKTKSKIEIVKSIIDELPEAPVVSYFLCDSWYTSAKLMAPLIKKGFYTIGALKTNRIIYPYGIRTSIKEFASFMRKQDPNISLVTAGGRQFYVYRYEGKLNNSATIYNCLKKLKLGTFISDVNIKHIIAIMLSVFTISYALCRTLAN